MRITITKPVWITSAKRKSNVKRCRCQCHCCVHFIVKLSYYIGQNAASLRSESTEARFVIRIRFENVPQVKFRLGRNWIRVILLAAEEDVYRVPGSHVCRKKHSRVRDLDQKSTTFWIGLLEHSNRVRVATCSVDVTLIRSVIGLY